MARPGVGHDFPFVVKDEGEALFADFQVFQEGGQGVYPDIHTENAQEFAVSIQYRGAAANARLLPGIKNVDVGPKSFLGIFGSEYRDGTRGSNDSNFIVSVLMTLRE